MEQAEDRVHRIGQNDNVIVEYLAARGTIDDYFWKKLESKSYVLHKAGLASTKNAFKEARLERQGERRVSVASSSSTDISNDESSFFDPVDDALMTNVEVESSSLTVFHSNSENLFFDPEGDALIADIDVESSSSTVFHSSSETSFFDPEGDFLISTMEF